MVAGGIPMSDEAKRYERSTWRRCWQPFVLLVAIIGMGVHNQGNPGAKLTAIAVASPNSVTTDWPNALTDCAPGI